MRKRPPHKRPWSSLGESPRAAGLWLLAVAGVVFIVLSDSGCAYFNLFYNTRKVYARAEDAPRTPEGEPSREALDLYGRVIEKCEMLITTYPNSSWVDDALLMMGKCFYKKEEYNDAITKFAELKAGYPESELNEEGQLYLGKCYLAKDDPEQAIPILQALYEAYPKGKFTDHVLYLLGTSSIKTGNEAGALEYLEILADKYSKSNFRISADFETADIYLERGEYDKALAIFDNLAKTKLDEKQEMRFVMKMMEVYVNIGRYDEALKGFDKMRRREVNPRTQARLKLLAAQAYRGQDNMDRAIEVYKNVASSFRKSMFSAEAYYRLGVLYEELDSLIIARDQFDKVPQQYANSKYAEDAIQRSSNISKLVKLRQSLRTGGTEGAEVAQFDLAEVNLFQFRNYEKALHGYKKFLNDFPNSELAPRAAWAIAYIYDELLGDETAARKAYTDIVEKYPDSQQAEFARKFLSDERASEQ